MPKFLKISFRVLAGLCVVLGWMVTGVEWVNKPEEVATAWDKIKVVAGAVGPSNILFAIAILLVTSSFVPALWARVNNGLGKRTPSHLWPCSDVNCTFCRSAESEVMLALTNAVHGASEIFKHHVNQIGAQRGTEYLRNQLEGAIPPLLKKNFPPKVLHDYRAILRLCHGTAAVKGLRLPYQPIMDWLAATMLSSHGDTDESGKVTLVQAETVASSPCSPHC